MIEYYKKIRKSGLNLKYFDGEDLRFEEFRNEIRSAPMFSEKKLIILKDTFLNGAFKEKFLKDFKKFLNSKNIILFYEEKEVDEKDSLFKNLKKYAKSQEFKLLKGQKLKNWVKKELRNYGVNIEEEALEKLIRFIGNNLWQFSNEIKKLVSYRAPRQQGEGGKENKVLFDHKERQKIGLKDVELLVKPKIEADVFKTIDAIALRNKIQALSLVHKHLEKGDSPLYLLHMINFQFRNLLIIKDLIERDKTYNTILKQIKLHPYIIKKSYWQAEKFTIAELKKIYQKIFQVDLAVKTGKIEPETALDLLIAEI